MSMSTGFLQYSYHEYSATILFILMSMTRTAYSRILIVFMSIQAPSYNARKHPFETHFGLIFGPGGSHNDMMRQNFNRRYLLRIFLAINYLGGPNACIFHLRPSVLTPCLSAFSPKRPGFEPYGYTHEYTHNHVSIEIYSIHEYEYKPPIVFIS